ALLPFTLAPRAEALRPAEASVPIASAAPAPAPTGGPRRALIVDDEATCRRVARTVLEQMQIECMESTNGAATLDLVREQPCDLVLLDLNLPDIDGYEICRRLRERPSRPYMKLIIVSGRGDQNQLAEVLTLGADAYIPKPFAVRQLEVKVQHALQL